MRGIVFISILIGLNFGCQDRSAQQSTKQIDQEFLLTSSDCRDSTGRGALLLSKFNSLDEFTSVVQIDYFGDPASGQGVRLTHTSCGRIVTKVLETGVTEGDFLQAREGDIWDRVYLCLRSPYILQNRNRLLQVELLARRRPLKFGEGDVAFYDLALAMVRNIDKNDKATMSARDLGEKGYLNTFNHISAQALMTSIFSADVADFISDSHERHKLPSLITGDFDEKLIADLDEGPVDNYLDMINNEWGQILGQRLKVQYEIDETTYWTPELMADYLNEVQAYCGWAFDIGFEPFRESDTVVKRFASKVNIVLGSESGLIAFYN